MRTCYILLLIIILGIVYILNILDKPTIERIKYGDSSPKNRLVISFSTIPSRISFINTTLQRLQNQILKPDMIYVCIPYYSKRFKTYYPEITINYPNVQIVRCNDYGPATKLLGCIPYENSPDTMIVTIDDDRIYNPNMLQTLVKYANRYTNCAIGYNALTKNLKSTICHPTKNITDPYVHYLEGFGGVLYRRKFITDEMLDFYENLSNECFLSDDLTISGWLAKQNICRIRICDEESQREDKYINDQNPLHKEKRKHVYNVCHNEMLNFL